MAITFKVIQKSVQGNKLNLSDQSLTNDDIPVICSFLNDNPQITKLDVSGNYIGDEGAKALAANRTLTSLDVRFNQIGAEGAKTLAANRRVLGDGIYGQIIKQAQNQYHISHHSKAEEPSSSSTTSISMMVLGGFIAVAGIAAIAIAFTVLNAATFGIAGLVVAGIGIAATLSGVGLFATGTYKNSHNTNANESLNLPRLTVDPVVDCFATRAPGV